MTSGERMQASQVIEDKLRERLEELESQVDGDVISLVGPMVDPIDDRVRTSIETLRADRTRDKLLVLLETDGGYAEIVQRIAETMRHHYNRVEFLVPNRAMSAGTILVMSGDDILMDYYSVLGPIDPQVASKSGKQVPALGYLVQYQRLMEKAQAGTLNTAEMLLLTESFDQADLYRYEQARNLSVTLLKDWLARYKFKDWLTTETNGTDVTPAMREQRATTIAEILNDTERWHTHGRGISMQVLRRDLNLRITDFEQDKALAGRIRQYYRLLMDYIGKIGSPGVIHTRLDLVPLLYY